MTKDRRHAASRDGSFRKPGSVPSPVAAREEGDELEGQLCFEVDDGAAGERLDTALSLLTEVPRAQIRRWIEAGRVTADGRLGKPGQRLAAGAVIEARPPPLETASVAPEAIEIDVVYEDDDLVVVNKPAHMVVHPAPGHPSGTLVNALLHRCGDLAGIGGVLRPGIVHRLDKGTSGLLVAAKGDRAHTHLARQFESHSVERVYLAFVRGVPSRDSGRIDRPIRRHPTDRKRMSVQAGSGREAVSVWEVIRRFPASSRSQLAVRPETGRTHQIRVHLASAGMPIVGDQVYGRARRRHARPAGASLDRPALHAAVLGFVHPSRGETLRFEAPLPADLDGLLAVLLARERTR